MNVGGISGRRAGCKSIEIPVRGSNEVVEVLTDELPEDASEIEAILCGEQAPLDLFSIFALEYYHRGQGMAFERLLRGGIQESHRRGDRRAIVGMASTLAAYYISKGLGLISQNDSNSNTNKDDSSREGCFEEATSLLNEAERCQSGGGPDIGLLLRKGLLLLAQGRTVPADYQLSVVAGREPDNVAAHAARAVCAVLGGSSNSEGARTADNMANWSMAISELQLVLRSLGPKCPLKVKHLLAHCWWRSGRADLARLAFERLLTEADDPRKSAGREDDRQKLFSPVEVLVSLAGLLLQQVILHPTGTAADGETVTRALHLFKAAYERDRTNPVALLHLANHFFFKGDADAEEKCQTLARSALRSLQNTIMVTGDNVHGVNGSRHQIQFLVGDLHYLLGKVAHRRGRWSDAMLEYTEAAKANPASPMVQLALGQVALQLGDKSLARECLERAAKSVTLMDGQQGDGHFWTMLGLLTSSPEYLDRAQHLLMADPSSTPPFAFDLFRGLASFYESRNPTLACKYYCRLQEIDRERFHSSFSILLNYAIMLHLSERYEMSTEQHGPSTEKSDLSTTSVREEIMGYLDECQQLAQGNTRALNLVKFNRARLLEDYGDGESLTKAEALYQELVNSGDGAVHLRLGIICTHRGQSTEAAEHFKEALGSEEQQVGTASSTNNASSPGGETSEEVDAWLLLARNHLLAKALTPARKAFERILRTHDRHNPFALIALGNIYVELARTEKRPDGRKEYLRRALEFYAKVLSLSTSGSVSTNNWVAAQGIGIVLAELGRYHEAKDVFLQIKQALAPKQLGRHPEVLLNLGHCWVELGQWSAALTTYEQALSLMPSASSSSSRATAIHLYMARTCYVQGREERNVVALEEAIRILERASRHRPDDAPIKFNLALAQQEVAVVFLKRHGRDPNDRRNPRPTGSGGSGETTSPSTVSPAEEMEELKRAIQLVDVAQETFASISNASSTDLNQKIIEQRIKYCQSLCKLLSDRHTQLATHHEQLLQQLDLLRHRRQQEELAERTRREEEEKKRLEEEQRREAIRQEMAAKLRLTEERVRAARSSDTDSDKEDDEVAKESETKRPRRREHASSKRKRGKPLPMQPGSDDDSGGGGGGGGGNKHNDNDDNSDNGNRGKRSMALSVEFITDTEGEEEQ